MSNNAQLVIPLAEFKNIVVTVTENAEGKLEPSCIETILCNNPDTLINFQIANPTTAESDYRFEMPKVTGDVEQLSDFVISLSGKMLTVCNANTEPGKINITLKVYDYVTPQKKGELDPEVANQPLGAQYCR
ncbi:hypothetical protein ACL9RI_10610 [Janthinobacterium sp. Mn2066]|uniref:hypothetical protein n=1 Tax=Janthinobacterium sp. Mn2066 TaxID=3395264 RepID=UPI003BE87266